jgi:hypothetical protein
MPLRPNALNDAVGGRFHGRGRVFGIWMASFLYKRAATSACRSSGIISEKFQKIVDEKNFRGTISKSLNGAGYETWGSTARCPTGTGVTTHAVSTPQSSLWASRKFFSIPVFLGNGSFAGSSCRHFASSSICRVENIFQGVESW